MHMSVNWSSKAGAFGHSECFTLDDLDTGARVTRATEYNQYSKAAKSAVPLDRAKVAGCTVWDGQARVVRQCVSYEHFEPATRNGGCARFNVAGVANSTRGYTKQTAPASADVHRVHEKTVPLYTLP